MHELHAAQRLEGRDFRCSEIELHERFADRLDQGYADLPELDEFVGYHLEQAYRLRTELGESDRRTAQLAEDGGRRLGNAGVRALKRGDMPATASLLERSSSLIVADRALRDELRCELAIALRTSGDARRAESLLAETISNAQARADNRLAARARIEHEYLRVLQQSTTTGDALLAAISEGIPIFETVDDDRSSARTWLLKGFVLGVHRGNYELARDATERALTYYERCRWPIDTCLGQIAIALHYGPTSVPNAIARLEGLLETTSGRAGRANIEVFLGGLTAQAGDIDAGRDLVAAARAAFEDLGQPASAAIYCGGVLGEVELLAGNAPAAELILRELCLELERTNHLSHLASRAGDLAEALYAQGRLGEAEEWALVGEHHSAADDLDAKLSWLPVRAKVAAARGALDDAEELIDAAVIASEATDALNRRAKVHSDLAEVQRLAGRLREAASAYERAVAFFEQKGNRMGAERARLAWGPVLV